MCFIGGLRCWGGGEGSEGKACGLRVVTMCFSGRGGGVSWRLSLGGAVRALYVSGCVPLSSDSVSSLLRVEPSLLRVEPLFSSVVPSFLRVEPSSSDFAPLLLGVVPFRCRAALFAGIFVGEVLLCGAPRGVFFLRQSADGGFSPPTADGVVTPGCFPCVGVAPCYFPEDFVATASAATAVFLGRFVSRGALSLAAAAAARRAFFSCCAVITCLTSWKGLMPTRRLKAS